MKRAKIPLMIVPLTQEAEPFIYNSFLKSFRSAVKHNIVDPDLYYRIMHDALESLILDPSYQVQLAVYEPDPKEYLGWILGSSKVNSFAYVYVKQAFRNQGVATELIHAVLPNIRRPARYSLTLQATSFY